MSLFLQQRDLYGQEKGRFLKRASYFVRLCHYKNVVILESKEESGLSSNMSLIQLDKVTQEVRNHQPRSVCV